MAETIRRMVGSFPQEEQIGRTIDIVEILRLIIWQRLVPSIDGKRAAFREFLVFNKKICDFLLYWIAISNKSWPRPVALLRNMDNLMRVDVEEKFKAGLISPRTYKIFSASAISLSSSNIASAKIWKKIGSV